MNTTSHSNTTSFNGAEESGGRSDLIGLEPENTPGSLALFVLFATVFGTLLIGCCSSKPMTNAQSFREKQLRIQLTLMGVCGVVFWLWALVNSFSIGFDLGTISFFCAIHASFIGMRMNVTQLTELYRQRCRQSLACTLVTVNYVLGIILLVHDPVTMVPARGTTTTLMVYFFFGAMLWTCIGVMGAWLLTSQIEAIRDLYRFSITGFQFAAERVQKEAVASAANPMQAVHVLPEEGNYDNMTEIGETRRV
mmetsp:Transcript_65841/g.109432  ORF Transcript_65841/g.109432 Transcript_65841/m.109432 type:complete len:251 (+) Transcript_65841:192-944(+)|eukprot:CAMPEP_0119300686 /NCGR_PEP_ID=MMETSP1333-20130426/2599_1 /TAXON_ID=418940 /ORGANISM="Scyphosphaera apsteinii, Strain RCC1455" /LENGTH=250 /DNA_ID=CAMNT_0007302543 /DNA_START=177 /DNA_END=929 /DNA_ORIENTATION=+